MTENVKSSEVKLLGYFLDNLGNVESVEPGNELIKKLELGEFDAVLNNECFAKLDMISAFSDLNNCWKILAEKFAESLTVEEHVQRQHLIFCIGISALQLYIQNNFVGPTTANISLFGRHFSDEEKLILQETASKELSVDGEVPYDVSRHLSYLMLANVAFQSLANAVRTELKTVAVWRLRLLHIWQSLFEERLPNLKAQVSAALDEVFSPSGIITNPSLPREVQIVLHLEAGHLCHYYYEFTKADEHFNSALTLSGLNLALTGLLGKRTKYQENDLAQLVVTLEGSESVSPVTDGQTRDTSTSISASVLPKDVRLDHEYLLSETKLVSQIDQGRLSSVQQAVVLAVCSRHFKTHESVGSIVAEEALAYITLVLKHPCNWCVQSKALLLRSKWEWDSVQRMERSISQLEELISQFDRPQPLARERLTLLHAVSVSPKWKLELTMADQLMKAGAVNGACEIYLRLHQWEQVIRCYATQGRRERAEELIRQQLKVKETPNLWCHLGDVTSDMSHYETAWTLSNCRYSRAQKSLGFHYLHKAKFAECLPHFDKSLTINPMQIGVWFSYGCALLATQRFEEAAKAFRRCVNLDSDNFEAWSNLALAYVKSNQKPRAFMTLQEALKCEYENWRLWENYLLIGTDLGEVDEAIRAYGRMLDLKDKYADTEVLTVLVGSVCDVTPKPDADGDASNKQDITHKQSTEKLRSRLLELFGRLTSKVTTNSEVWRLYGKLLLSKPGLSSTDYERAVQYLQKAQRCITQAPNWEVQIDKCVEVAKLSVAVAKEILAASDHVDQAATLLTSARMMLRNTTKTIIQKHTTISGELPQQLQDSCKDMDDTLNAVRQKLEIINKAA